jgi:GntR family transcriptional regulator
MIIPQSRSRPSQLPGRATPSTAGPGLATGTSSSEQARRLADATALSQRRAGAGLQIHRGSRAIANDIAGHIRSGRLPAGSRLPTYYVLAEKYQVSVSTVQHAIALLNARGLTRGQRRCGVHVLPNGDLLNGRSGG